MSRISYESWNPQGATYDVIDRANVICAEFAEQGFDLTLRQLYYQFVARDEFPSDRTWRRTAAGKWERDPNGTINAEPNYKWLGDIVNKARLAGYIDWRYIVDRTRNLEALPHWADAGGLVDQASGWFNHDRWADQQRRVEVWIEKDALVGVIDGVCTTNDVPYFSCRGYTSQSELWGAAQRLGRYIANGQGVTVLHLGDHDPSGLDMSRDIEDRLWKFIATDLLRAEIRRTPTMRQSRPSQSIFLRDLRPKLVVDRIALNIDQVEQYDPPPNPAKQTDARWRGYVESTGLDESWELDALSPVVLADLIQEGVDRNRDAARWNAATAAEERERALLARASARWDEVVELLDEEAS